MVGPQSQGRGKRRLKGAFSWCGAKGGGVSRALAPAVDSFVNEAGDDDTNGEASEEAVGVSHRRPPPALPISSTVFIALPPGGRYTATDAIYPYSSNNASSFSLPPLVNRLYRKGSDFSPYSDPLFVNIVVLPITARGS